MLMTRPPQAVKMRRQQTHVAGENDSSTSWLSDGEGCRSRVPPLTVVAPPAPVQPLPPAGRVAASDAFDIGPVGHNDHGLVEETVPVGQPPRLHPLPEPEENGTTKRCIGRGNAPPDAG